jgi:hypothetical protein
MKKKDSRVGATSWYHCIAEDSRIPKMLVINPSKHLFIRKLKKLSCMDCQYPTPTSQNSLFLVNRFADEELWISIFQGIYELGCYKNPNLLF